jgi:hypothetical protein
MAAFWERQPLCHRAKSPSHEREMFSQQQEGGGVPQQNQADAQALELEISKLLEDIPRATSAPPHLQDAAFWSAVSIA